MLPLSDDVMAQLREKHPSPQEARLGSLLFGPVEDVPVPDSIYQQINGEMVREAALRTKGSGGPSALMRMGSAKSGTDLCGAIAAMTRRLCTEFIDPLSIETILGKSPHPPGQRKGRCPADRCRRSYAADNGKVRHARDEARIH